MAVIDLSFSETLQLIANFRKHPIIYDPSSIGYNDRKMKAEAWKTISREMGIHPETCKRKMESLLSSCRREKKLILKAREANGTYEPKWKYWNYFKFLRGLADDEEDPLGKAPDNPPDRKIDSPWSTARMLAHKYRDVDYPIEPIKKSESKQKTNAAQDDDEYTALGTMVEAKLKKMLEVQRFYAETIIHQALYKGLLFQLTNRSEIRDTDLPQMQMNVDTTKSNSTSSQKDENSPHDEDSCINSNIPTKRRKESPLLESQCLESPDVFKQML
ncbi:uncharacterized protein LOC143913681 [Arctopsyche grandis]|uniref:uncharacterized protein LOC143913681 n=1 Tax=Arctopsyche grandis TaxID=121162 RepID=UPI00406D8711